VLAPRGQVVVDSELRRPQPQFLEPADLRRRERLGGYIGKRGAVPELDRLARGGARDAVGALGAIDQPLEAGCVDRILG
jgi:hypothetical protein